MPDPFGTPDSETWGAYRKLITERLQRLNNQGNDINKTLGQHETRLFVIERSKLDERIDNVDEKVNKIERRLSEEKGKQSILNILTGAIWGVIVLFINALLNGKFLG